MSSSGKSDDILPPPIPEGCNPLSHQVAGHIYGKCKTRAGLLQDNKGSILKLLQTNNRGDREKKFYQIVFREDQNDPLLVQVRDLVAPFKGTAISTADPSVEYIKLSDVTTGFTHPCIMDVKIGRIGYEDGVNSKKVEAAKVKYPHMGRLGFQILGIRVYHPSTRQYSHYDKMYGRTLNETSMIEALAKFLNVDDMIRTDIMHAFLVRLKQILDWFEVQKSYHFYSSSLLFVYEGDIPKDASTNSLKQYTGDSHTHSKNSPQVGKRMQRHTTARTSVKPEDNTMRTKTHDNANLGMSDNVTSACQVTGNCLQSGENGDKATQEIDDVRESKSGISDQSAESRCNGMLWKNPEKLTNHSGSTDINSSGDLNSISHDSSQCGSHEQTSTSRSKSDRSVNGPFSNHLQHCLHSGREGDTHSNGDGNEVHHFVYSQSGLAGSRPRYPSDSNDNVKSVEVRMIDFAHAIEATTRDENYIFGLNMLMQYIKTLHDCHVG